MPDFDSWGGFRTPDNDVGLQWEIPEASSYVMSYSSSTNEIVWVEEKPKKKLKVIEIDGEKYV